MSRCNENSFLKRYPFVLLPIAVLSGAIGYGLPMLAMLWFFPISDGESVFWVALIFGYFSIFIVPHSLALALTEFEFLSLLFFVQGAVLGLLFGLIGVFVVYWNNWKDLPTMAPAYGWRCQVCGVLNEGASSVCIACRFPAVASANEIERAKLNGISSTNPHTDKETP